MSEIFTHIVYDGSFKKGKRSSFNKEIASKFNVIDPNVGEGKYNRCHSVSYLSIVETELNVFNLLHNYLNIGQKYPPELLDVAERHLSGIVLAVHKYPLIISDDEKSMSIDINYESIVKSPSVEKSFVEYAHTYSCLGEIFDLIESVIKDDFCENLAHLGNKLVEDLNNCSMNLRVGSSKWNSFVQQFYDVISYTSTDDGIIIDNEMDDCALSHIKHLMYDTQDYLDFALPNTIHFPKIYQFNDSYEIPTSYHQFNGDWKGWKRCPKANIYIHDWYTIDKKMILLNNI